MLLNPANNGALLPGGDEFALQDLRISAFHVRVRRTPACAVSSRLAASSQCTRVSQNTGGSAKGQEDFEGSDNNNVVTATASFGYRLHVGTEGENQFI
ncbi:hypothetical protein EYF80_034676 [Liparis tanakae]|uniref:Uncharacterized protein n=1 Tax=Liparis tanakae TaxID=230148 RepID=A0A4Z2GQV8_9TELE|nr:hypothetical protein EYF80_034676 [Liparis tanakae]